MDNLIGQDKQQHSNLVSASFSPIKLVVILVAISIICSTNKSSQGKDD